MLRFNRQCLADRAAGLLEGLTPRRLSAPARLFASPPVATIWCRWGLRSGRCRSTRCWTSRPRISSRFSTITGSCMTIGRSGARSTAAAARYVEKLTAPFRDRIRLGAAVTAIERGRDGVTVDDSLGHTERYDQVVIAAHSDQALAMLRDPSDDERAVLGAIRYRPNAVYLHRDPRLMPKRKRAWAAWNFLRGHGRGEAGGDVAVTYWMNALQRIDPAMPAFRQPQSAFRAGTRSHLRAFQLRSSAIRRRGLRGTEAARRHPGREPHLVLRSLDRIWFSRRRSALGTCGRRAGSAARFRGGRRQVPFAEAAE